MYPGSFSTTPFPFRFLVQLLTPVEFVVYAYFCSRADNRTGWSRISNARLARETGYSISHAKKAKRYLTWLGLIEVRALTNRNGGQGVSTTRVVDIPQQHWLFAVNPDWDPDDWKKPVPDERKDEPLFDHEGGVQLKSGYQRRFLRKVLSRVAFGDGVEPSTPEQIIEALRFATRSDDRRPTLVQRAAADLRAEYHEGAHRRAAGG